MQVTLTYDTWNSAIKRYSTLDRVTTLPSIRVYTDTLQKRTIVLTSKGLCFEISELPLITYRGINCVLIEFSSELGIFSENGRECSWERYIGGALSISPTYVQCSGTPVQELRLKCGDSGASKSKKKQPTEEDTPGRSIVATPLDLTLSAWEYSIDEDADYQRPSGSEYSEVGDASTPLPSLVFHKPAEGYAIESVSPLKMKARGLLRKPVVITFLGSLLILGIIFGILFIKYAPRPAKPPAVDPFVYTDSSWEFPEAREHPYPGFEFMDRIDPDDEHGVTTSTDAPVPRNLAEAKELNEDVHGWIKIPGTSVSSPVLWTDMGNNYYLGRNILKQQVFSGNTSGVIFADTANKLDSKNALSGNTVVYGHNWTNSTRKGSEYVRSLEDKQFGPLMYFSDKSFADKYRRFTITTDDGQEHQLAIFAAFYTEIGSSEFFQYNDTQVTGANQMMLINRARQYSLWNYPMTVDESDKIVTLSTCSMDRSRNGSGRFVVMGKLVDSVGQVPTGALKENIGTDAYIPIAVDSTALTSSWAGLGNTKSATNSESLVSSEFSASSSASVSGLPN